MRIPASPTIYEINTAAWLQRLGRKLGRPLELGEVPGAEWDALDHMAWVARCRVDLPG